MNLEHRAPSLVDTRVLYTHWGGTAPRAGITGFSRVPAAGCTLAVLETQFPGPHP